MTTATTITVPAEYAEDFRAAIVEETPSPFGFGRETAAGRSESHGSHRVQIQKQPVVSKRRLASRTMKPALPLGNRLAVGAHRTGHLTQRHSRGLADRLCPAIRGQ